MHKNAITSPVMYEFYNWVSVSYDDFKIKLLYPLEGEWTKNPSDPNHHGPKNSSENSRSTKLDRLRGVEILHLFSIDASIKTSVKVHFF